MHETSFAKMGAFASRYLADSSESPLRIVDIGARSVLGHQTYRNLFNRPNWQFCGLDIEAGHNVDLVVSDPYHWAEVNSGSFDVAISGQALEHVEYPWKTFQEIFRILRPGGLFCLIVPSSGEEHRYPVDCWRFYPDSMRALASDSGFRPVEVFTDFGLGNRQDTFAVFQKPIADDAKNSFPLMEDKGAAFFEYYKALSSRPRNPTYYLNLGRMLRERGRDAEANLVFRIGTELFPGESSLRQEVAAALLAAGEIIAAAEHVASLLGARPITSSSVDVAGAVFERLSLSQRTYYGKLLPNETPPLKQIARLAMQSGHYRLAAANWERVAIREPADETHRENYFLALYGAGERSEAIAGFVRLRDEKIASSAITRATVIQQVIAASGAKRYLEIGVERGINFFQIEAQSKFAVDPAFKIPGGANDFECHQFFEMTSDQFFESLPAEIIEHGIDIALVDGLHTYEQALRDVENCLKHLNPGGLIVMHDCLPASAVESAPSLKAAQAMPDFKNAWTGDVYKAVVHLRAQRPDIFVAVLDSDHGVGLVMTGQPESRLSVDLESIQQLSYEELRLAPGHWLNLKPATWFSGWLNNRFSTGL